MKHRSFIMCESCVHVPPLGRCPPEGVCVARVSIWQCLCVCVSASVCVYRYVVWWSLRWGGGGRSVIVLGVSDATSITFFRKCIQIFASSRILVCSLCLLFFGRSCSRHR